MKPKHNIKKIMIVLFVSCLLILSSCSLFRKNGEETAAPQNETAETTAETTTPAETGETTPEPTAPTETIEPMEVQESTEIEVEEGEQGSF